MIEGLFLFAAIVWGALYWGSDFMFGGMDY